jgi:hypothetical protein
LAQLHTKKADETVNKQPVKEIKTQPVALLEKNNTVAYK